MRSKQGETQQSREKSQSQGNLKRTRGAKYPTELKIKACVAALTVNPDYPSGVDAVKAAMLVLNAPIASRVLDRWLVEYKPQITALMPVKPTTQELVTQQYNETIQAWSQVEKLSLEHLVTGGKIQEASARDTAVVAGIARTHLSKMISLDASLVESVAKLQALCQRLGLDVKAVIDDNITVYERIALPPLNVTPSTPSIEPGITSDNEPSHEQS